MLEQGAFYRETFLLESLGLGGVPRYSKVVLALLYNVSRETLKSFLEMYRCDKDTPNVESSSSLMKSLRMIYKFPYVDAIIDSTNYLM